MSNLPAFRSKARPATSSAQVSMLRMVLGHTIQCSIFPIDINGTTHDSHQVTSSLVDPRLHVPSFPGSHLRINRAKNSVRWYTPISYLEPSLLGSCIHRGRSRKSCSSSGNHCSKEAPPYATLGVSARPGFMKLKSKIRTSQTANTLSTPPFPSSPSLENGGSTRWPANGNHIRTPLTG